jgi:hypothetical protein
MNWYGRGTGFPPRSANKLTDDTELAQWYRAAVTVSALLNKLTEIDDAAELTPTQ